ncbi:MAG: type II toxin-antitoxin system VapB family antitoxin [Bryobacteraceae bacterium]
MSDAIQIRRPEVAAAIRELASLRDVSLTDAIADAVHAQLVTERLNREQKQGEKHEAMQKFLAYVKTIPHIGAPETDDDYYDEEGMPK